MPYDYPCKNERACCSFNECKAAELEKEDLAILLGAGSSNNGDYWSMPDWSSLLRRMLNGMGLGDFEVSSNAYLPLAGIIEDGFHRENKKTLGRRLNQNGIFLPESALDTAVLDSTTSQLAAYVQTLLAKDCQVIQSMLDKPSAKALKSSTVYAVAEACIKRARRNKRTIIITYCYDDLFEHVLRKKAGENITVQYHSYVASGGVAERAMKSLAKNEKRTIEIYYAHGRIPLFSDPHTNPENGIVLSDQSYDELKRRIISFSNQIQYAVMTAFPTITCGFSCDDENFRRLRKDLASSERNLPSIVTLYHCKNGNDCPSGTRPAPNDSCACTGRKLLELSHLQFKPLVVKFGHYLDIFNELIIPAQRRSSA